LDAGSPAPPVSSEDASTPAPEGDLSTPPPDCWDDSGECNLAEVVQSPPANDTFIKTLIAHPASIIGVEFKTGHPGQDAPAFETMSFGVPYTRFVQELMALGVNTLRIPAAGMDQLQRVSVLQRFLQGLVDHGFVDFGIVLSQKGWHLHRPANQEALSDAFANAYRALAQIGLDDRILGVMFGENEPLKGLQSDKQQWDKRHMSVLKTMAMVNTKTDGFFTSRAVYILGRGHGSQFTGVKASSDFLGFHRQIRDYAANHVYSYKLFQEGKPSSLSLDSWRAHFRRYDGLDEVTQLAVPIIFVGDASDGLRGGSFVEGKSPYGGGAGQYVIKALRDVFLTNKWTGFALGPFLVDPAVEKVGRTTLFVTNGGDDWLPQEETIAAFMTWRDSTRSEGSVRKSCDSSSLWRFLPRRRRVFVTHCDPDRQTAVSRATAPPMRTTREDVPSGAVGRTLCPLVLPFTAAVGLIWLWP